MPSKDMNKKQEDVKKIPLGSGLAENAKNKLSNRQAELDARIAAATGGTAPKKKNK